MNHTSAPSKRVPGTDHFLNRISFEYECDPHRLNLVPVLRDFFNYADLNEHMELFEQFCTAAMQERYTWKTSCPANGLYYGERLELLVETVYLLQLHSWKPVKKVKPKKHRVHVHEFPVYLTGNEYLHPMTFINVFFAHAGLSGWKKMLSAFMCNALSPGSVAAELPGEDLLPFALYMKKLICAAHRILELSR